MKTRMLWVVATILLWPLSGAVSLFAQDMGETFVTEHYSVYSEAGRDDARETGRRLEAYLALYNGQFRFPLEEMDRRLSVRLFDSQSRYEGYIDNEIGEVAGDVVYLHYSDPGRRELVGLTGDETSDAALIHQSFVQYLRAFVPHPPLWIREGFAVHYAATQYDEGFHRAVYEENLAWLDTLKEMVPGTSSRPWIPWENLLFLSVSDAQEMADSFYPQAWGLVSFLVNADDPAINRLVWDSISAMEPEYSLRENSQAVYQRAFRWVDRAEVQNRFSRYVMSRRTFSQWVSTGVDRYAGDDPEGAERAMVEALRLRNDHHVPFYYLGLISYDREDYETAAHYYGEALSRTDSPAPVLYALAVNAIADDRREEAREYLESMIAGDAGTGDDELQDEAEALLRRLAPSGSR